MEAAVFLNSPLRVGALVGTLGLLAALPLIFEQPIRVWYYSEIAPDLVHAAYGFRAVDTPNKGFLFTEIRPGGSFARAGIAIGDRPFHLEHGSWAFYHFLACPESDKQRLRIRRASDSTSRLVPLEVPPDLRAFCLPG